MKWWKQSKSQKLANPISILSDRLFSINKTKLNFIELLKYVQLEKTNIKESNVNPLISLALEWNQFLEEIPNTTFAERSSLIYIFNNNIINKDNSKLLNAFDDTFPLSVLYHNENDYFELENFIIPILLKLKDVDVEDNLTSIALDYYCQGAVKKTMKEIKDYELNINISELEKTIPNILQSDIIKPGQQYNIIANMHSITIGGLGPISGFLIKYHGGCGSIERTLRHNCTVLLVGKLKAQQVAKINNHIELKIVKNKMITRVNAGIIKDLAVSNLGIINTLGWLRCVELSGGQHEDTIKYDTILSVLDALHLYSNFNKTPPSQKLIKAVIDMTLLHSTYNKGVIYGLGTIGGSYDNFIFHPFISKVLQSNRVDEKVIKQLVSHGSNLSLLILASTKCQAKNKHMKSLIKNNIYTLSVKKKFLAEKKLRGLSRNIKQNLCWDGDKKSLEFWKKQKHNNRITKKKSNSLELIDKTCDKLFDDINNKNGNDHLAVFG